MRWSTLTVMDGKGRRQRGMSRRRACSTPRWAAETDAGDRLRGGGAAGKVYRVTEAAMQRWIVSGSGQGWNISGPLESSPAVGRLPSLVRNGYEATYACVTVQEECQIGSHHFFPALKSLVNPSVRIGIVLIVRGIVVAKIKAHARALRHV